MTEQQWHDLATLYRQALDELLKQRPDLKELWRRGEYGLVHGYLRERISASVSVG